jgi:replicative DNA helicase
MKRAVQIWIDTLKTVTLNEDSVTNLAAAIKEIQATEDVLKRNNLMENIQVTGDWRTVGDYKATEHLNKLRAAVKDKTLFEDVQVSIQIIQNTHVFRDLDKARNELGIIEDQMMTFGEFNTACDGWIKKMREFTDIDKSFVKCDMMANLYEFIDRCTNEYSDLKSRKELHALFKQISDIELDEAPGVTEVKTQIESIRKYCNQGLQLVKVG